MTRKGEVTAAADNDAQRLEDELAEESIVVHYLLRAASRRLAWRAAISRSRLTRSSANSASRQYLHFAT
jgi:hypothetical protein